ncbi:hypothetical protein LCGC14_0234640 [marine sediment metagenome]|uniref:DUF423 domain-containing protein n=1 Tax=marine sediment metagenome TaxID=412755 RepID=A0A0F9UE15_9ZZZZ
MTALLIVFAGLFGAAGVAGAAIAAHGGDTRLVAIAAGIALVHAPALLALAALRPVMPRLSAIAGMLLIAGTLLFSGDLAAREVWGERLFTNAAPLGGMILIGAWLMTTIAGLIVGMARDRSMPPAR